MLKYSFCCADRAPCHVHGACDVDGQYEKWKGVKQMYFKRWNALIWMVVAASMVCGCDDSEDRANGEVKLCGNGVVDPGEECDGSHFGMSTCDSLVPGSKGELRCDACVIDTSGCTWVSSCNLDGKKDVGEECDGSDLGGATCASVDPSKPYGQLGCTQECKYYKHYCSASDLRLQAPYVDVEQTDALCSNGVNDFRTVDNKGNISSWFDCANHGCVTSPIVQVCHTIENNDVVCSDGIDNTTSAALPTGMREVQNGLVDCQDPSCYKNWRVSVCDAQAPRWELGAECSDGKDNDGDGLADCEDPDCLHAGASECELGDRVRVLFDNAHHQIAGQVDWIIDVTGRHPYPSEPKAETDWHGSLSSFGKDLLDTGRFVPETLPQNRKLTYKKSDSVQDLSNYTILVLVEPSAKFSPDESAAVAEFVKDGGRVFYFADHKGSDRDGNNVDSVDALNDLILHFPGATDLEQSPIGFYALGNDSMANDTAVPAVTAPAKLLDGPHGKIRKTGSYAGTAFKIVDESKANAWLTTVKGAQVYAVAASYGKGAFVAVGDSSIAGDGTNFLGITLSKAAYRDSALDNRVFLLNTMEWLYSHE